MNRLYSCNVDCGNKRQQLKIWDKVQAGEHNYFQSLRRIFSNSIKPLSDFQFKPFIRNVSIAEWKFFDWFSQLYTRSGKSALMNRDSQVVSLTRSLVDKSSCSEAVGFVRDWLKARDWNVSLQLVPSRNGDDKENRMNVFATRFGDPNPSVVFCSHLDTVPPFIPSSIGEDGFLYGRGVCDARGLVASMLVAAQNFSKGVGLLFVTGEETDHAGMIEANKLGLDTKYLVVGEPTENKMAVAQAGVLKMKLISQGVSCHSAYPERGKSATVPLIKLLSELLEFKDYPKDPELGETILNVGVIGGGIASKNVYFYCMCR